MNIKLTSDHCDQLGTFNINIYKIPEIDFTCVPINDGRLKEGKGKITRSSVL